MTAPKFDFEQPIHLKKWPFAWPALWLVFAFLIGTQLFDYLSPRPQGSFDPVQVDQQVETLLKIREGTKQLVNRGILPKQSQKEFDEPIKPVISELAIARKTDPVAARFYLATRFEVGETIGPSDFEILRNNPSERNNAAIKIYSSKTIDQNDLEGLSKALPGPLFFDKLILLHAHEKAGDKSFRTKELPLGDYLILMAAFFGITASCGLGTMILVWYLVARASGRIKPKGHTAGIPSTRQNERFAWRVATGLLGFIIVGSVVSLILPFLGFIPETTHSTIAMAFVGLFLILLFKFGIDGSKISFADIGFRKDQLWGDIATGVLAAIANVPLLICALFCGLSLFSGLPAPSHPLNTELALNSSVWVTVVLFIGAAVFAPLIEETIFRGVLTPALHSLSGSRAMAIVFNGLLFAAIHPTGIPAWPVLAMVGITAAHITYLRQSLVPAIAMHAVHNGVLVIFTQLL